jgi:nucleotide-binding universal stress UspA family protein
MPAESETEPGEMKMAPRIIVSYDDTDNDRDALALGRLLAFSGADLSLAYVRHFPESDPQKEKDERRKAEELLSRGAEEIGAPEMARHVVLHASTSAGLAELASRENADIVVFGSDYRTPAGAVAPGQTAERLLNGGSTAVAVAPADMRSRSSVSVSRIGFLAESGDDSAEETAGSLAAGLGASVADADDGAVDLLVVGSREGTPDGRLELSSAAENAVEAASAPVLAVPRAAAIQFAAPVSASA